MSIVFINDLSKDLKFKYLKTLPNTNKIKVVIRWAKTIERK